MRIVIKSLTNLVSEAITRVSYEYGEGYGLKVMGAWLSLEKDKAGEDVAIFYTSTFEDYFDLDIVEKSLKFYVGALEKPFFTPPIEVLKDPVETWRKKQREFISSVKKVLISQGKDETEATIEAMFFGSDFSEIREGTRYECMNAHGVKNITEMALKRYNSVEIRIEKSESEYWDRHIIVSILKTED